MANRTIKNVYVYQLKDGRYYISFRTQNGYERFSGTRADVLKYLILRVKRVLRVREK